MKRHLGWAIVLAITVISSPLAAQQLPQTVTWGGKEVPLRQSLLSINPLGLVFEYFSGEFEHAVSRSTSLAVSGSWLSPYDITYTSADLIGRYYPAEQGLRGFSIGPSVGYTHLTDKYCYGCSTTTNAVTVGVQLNYGWILGPSQHFGVELGLGAKRLFYQGSAGNGSEALPTGRLSIGYAF